MSLIGSRTALNAGSGSPPQHVDIAALLIKYNTCVNATDKWAFTPLHEAAQKGRTQLCALLLAHGADPTMKNQEGQTALDLATVSLPLLTASGFYSATLSWRALALAAGGRHPCLADRRHAPRRPAQLL